MLAPPVAVGPAHVCAVLAGNRLRCWGAGVEGQLGRGSTASIGDDEAPASAGDIDLGAPVLLP